jgi:hypothetical protein
MPTSTTSDTARNEEEMRRRDLRARARAMPAEAVFICDTLRLARLCRRIACKRADACRGDARMCLDSTGEAVPLEVFDWAVQRAQARQDGEPDNEVAANHPDEALAWRCWSAGLDAVRR